MHPAKSVIFFTCASGAGYGLLIWTAMFAAFGVLEPLWGLGVALLGTAFVLIVTGLLSSTLHLGHPERAWRGLTQWRTSWLSREAVLALLTFVPAGVFAWGWIMAGSISGPWMIAGLIATLLAVATVYSTGMIYASLKTIPAWHHPMVTPGYIVLALMTGGVLFLPISQLWFLHVHGPARTTAMVLIALGLIVKVFYWHTLKHLKPKESASSATGLKGKVTMLEGPHDQANYLMKEMGFEVGRKHAAKLRVISLFLGFVAPFACVFGSAFVKPDYAFGLLTVAVFLTTIGIAAERWLFFAEAKHVQTLYYGKGKV